MNLALVEPIVNAVLYEGYMLYPYRPSSVKNRQRWTFGGVYPQAYSETQIGSDVWTVQTECLIVADEQRPEPQLDLMIRFLHLMAREIGELMSPLAELPPDREPDFQVVAALQVGERLFQTWQEVTERAIDIADVRLSDLIAGSQRLAFVFGPSRTLEPLREPGGAIIGVSVREQQRIEGAVELAAEQLDAHVFKLSVRVLNLTPLATSDVQNREAALLRSFVSTHMILGVRDGVFSSLFDPPEQLREATSGCRNIGVWPVLVGEEPARDMLLASPIILYDYPQIAPESPGDLFDGTEIDEILTLRIMTMTEDEKREMIAVDERARTMLERTEALAREQMMGLHGIVRGMRSLEEAS
jgi:hydrogenase maturation protease